MADVIPLHRLAFSLLPVAVVLLIMFRWTLYAVGIVSIPGMMTGQILAEVSPLIAARYQIMVMSMLFGSAGLSAALFLWLLGRNEAKQAILKLDQTK